MMSVLRKAYPAELRPIDDDEGTVEALVSVFGNVDFQGDRVVKGAFAKSIAKWQESGDPIPVVVSHDWGDLWSHIGYADPRDLEETDVGLKTRYKLDVHDNPVAAQAYRLMKRRTLKQHSYAYDVLDERVAKDGANELLELDLIELGPTLVGANSETDVLAIKSALEKQTARKTPPWHIEDDNSDCDGFAVVADETGEVVGCHDTRDAAESHMSALYANVDDASKGVKAGRTLSKANEAKIRGAIDALTQVLSSLGDPEDEKSTDPPSEKAEDEKEPVEVETEGKATAEANGKTSDDALLSLKTQIEKLRS